MLINALLPLLARYSLRFDLIAGPDENVTLTIIPQKIDGDTRSLESTETRPISITATAAEIDGELSKGTEGALGRLFAARKTLADQINDQHEAEQAAKAAAAQANKAKAASSSKTAPSASAIKATSSSELPEDASADDPTRLW